jgi:putative ABC transport system permease protein
MKQQMIISGLKARPVRTTVSVLAVALEVILILVIIGLANGISQETGRRTEGVGADLLVQPPNSSLLFAMSQSVMSLNLGDKLRELEGVKVVAPVQTMPNNSAGLEIVYGIQPDTFQALSSGFIWVRGGMFKHKDEVIVDDIYADAKRVSVGDTIRLVEHEFKITGIVEHGKGSRLFVPFEAAEDMMEREGKVSLFFIKLDDPEKVQSVKAKVEELLPGYKITPIKEYTELMMSNTMPVFNAFISSVVFISLCIGVLVIFLSMYTTITERTREIGILRSLGASKGFIVQLIFRESALICLIGVVVGIGGSFLLAKGVTAMFPTLLVLITPGWIFRAAVFALLSGVIGSLYPSLKAASQDPVEALAYE